PGGPPGYDSVETHRRDTQLKNTDYWKVLVDGRIVGGTRVNRVNDRHHYIYGVFIDPDFHGKGIGTEFFNLIESRYPHVEKWSLDTPEWNPRTKAFYEKLGFIQVGVLRWVPTFDLRYYVKLTDTSYRDNVARISELGEGMSGLIVEGEITKIAESREVTSSKDWKKHHVANATIMDETGTATLVLWDDMIRQIRSGETVRAENVYLTEFRGQLQINVHRSGQLIIRSPQLVSNH
ncbi:MAG: GNAT family N-acetyltransferase, partial [Candidatus Thorarchaeota archaeon]